MSLALTISSRFVRSLRADRLSQFTTRVSTASVAIGCLALIVSMSILKGYEEAIVHTATRFSAHVEIRSVGGSSIANAPDVALNILAVPGVRHVEAMMQRETLVRTRRGIDGGAIVGLNAARLQELAPLLASGTMPDSNGVMLGALLAQNIQARVGDTVMLITAEGSEGTAPVLTPIRVAGIVHTGMHLYDESAVVMRYQDAQRILRIAPGMATALGVTVQDVATATDMAIAISRQLPHTLYTQSYLQRFSAMASWIELQKRPIPIVLGLISIVAVFTVVSTLLIAVVEKTKSVAILLTLGMRPATIIRVFLFNGLRIGAIGTLVGIVGALSFSYVQNTWSPIRLDGSIYYVTTLPVSYDIMPYLVVPGISLVLCLVASAVPVWLASRINPVAALRFG